MKEIWKDIPGYDGHYQVSNYGIVKSIKFGNERILKPFMIKGYKYIECYYNKIQKNFGIHQLVAMAFLGHQPDGMNTVVNHMDNNPLNNHVDNLELVSQRHNSSCHKKDVGVTWDKHVNKWKSSIYINGKNIHLGYFINKEDALDMYQKALDNIHLYDGDAKAFRVFCFS